MTMQLYGFQWLCYWCSIHHADSGSLRPHKVIQSVCGSVLLHNLHFTIQGEASYTCMFRPGNCPARCDISAQKKWMFFFFSFLSYLLAMKQKKLTLFGFMKAPKPTWCINNLSLLTIDIKMKPPIKCLKTELSTQTQSLLLLLTKCVPNI